LAGFKEENIVGDNGVRPELEQKEQMKTMVF
jgi:hypothetical protein